jgi:DNA-binding transcriptional regulator YiaG
MRKTKSPILDAVHDTAKGLHKAGVMDQVTLREFDQFCLPPVEHCSLSKSSTFAKPRGSARRFSRAC